MVEVTMAGRKIRDEQDARECLSAIESGDLSRGEWSRRNGVDGRSLNAWSVNLRRRAKETASSTTIRMLELVPAGQPAAEYRVRCGPFVVELDERFDNQVLSRLLAVVAEC